MHRRRIVNASGDSLETIINQLLLINLLDKPLIIVQFSRFAAVITIHSLISCDRANEILFCLDFGFMPQTEDSSNYLSHFTEILPNSLEFYSQAISKKFLNNFIFCYFFNYFFFVRLFSKSKPHIVQMKNSNWPSQLENPHTTKSNDRRQATIARNWNADQAPV